MRISLLWWLVPLLQAFNIIPSVIRPATTIVFLDTTISSMHRQAFQDALSTWQATGYCDIRIGGSFPNLIAKFDNLNTVTYSNYTIISSSRYYGSYNPDKRNWDIMDTDFIINPANLTTYSASFNAFLHEIGHALFLEHDYTFGSVMNGSISVYTNGTTMHMALWTLHPENIYGAYINALTSFHFRSNSFSYGYVGDDKFILSASNNFVIANKNG